VFVCFQFYFVYDKICEVFNDIMEKFFIRILMHDFGIFRFISLLMECSCMGPLTPVVMVTMGLYFQPLFSMVLLWGSYLLCLCMRAWSGNLS
jgi:hypothetical protein